MNVSSLLLLLLLTVSQVVGQETQPAWKNFVSKPGPTGWRCHVVQPDPHDDGPDGINIHDWDDDGDLDLFVNAEEGKYSRLYFNPGKSRVRELWNDYIEFSHGQCEDSGIGDLDGDGDIDYVANGGRVYFNPGKDQLRNPDAWTLMVLFEHERRVPTVFDVDRDGLNDLIVGAQEWYKQPDADKHNAARWQRFEIGKNRWPMNCLMRDIDKDGDFDMVVPDRGIEICWYENPGRDQVHQSWQRQLIHDHTEPMFMAVDDVNGDQRDDFAIAGGSKGQHANKLLVLIRKQESGTLTFQEFTVDQPSGLFPKGIAVAELDGKPSRKEILVIPKSGDLWVARAEIDDDRRVHGWSTEVLKMPGADTRKKMDNAWLGDLDSDGDLDVVTTEENGGWGVIWFENPAN